MSMSQAGANAVESDLVPGRQQIISAAIGVVVFLASWFMLFSALFFAYGAFRTKAVVWPPMDLPAMPVMLGLISTGILIISSVVVHFTMRAMHRCEKRKAGRLGLCVSLLGLVFILVQFWSWQGVYEQGLHWQSSHYGAVFYSLTVLHAVHVMVGLLAWIIVSLALLGLTKRWQPTVVTGTVWAYYWHFVLFVWLFMYVTVYLY